MRATPTPDDDVAGELKTTGQPLPEIVNETPRRGLEGQRSTAQQRTFKITARDLGNLNPGLSLENVAALIEHSEGALHS